MAQVLPIQVMVTAVTTDLVRIVEVIRDLLTKVQVSPIQVIITAVTKDLVQTAAVIGDLLTKVQVLMAQVTVTAVTTDLVQAVAVITDLHAIVMGAVRDLEKILNILINQKEDIATEGEDSYLS